jgi:LuxR family glucitol operon transcriptional activator
MVDIATKLNRNYGYDILINTFEPYVRTFISDDVLTTNYGAAWLSYIPTHVQNEVKQNKEDSWLNSCLINDFFEEITFLNLKDIIISFQNFDKARAFFGELSKDKFVELMDKLNFYRRKIAHARSAFSDIDLATLIDCVELLCQGEASKPVRMYLQNQQYKNAREVPLAFYEEYDCQNNLPPESYDLDGGFVGRWEEIKALKKLIRSEQDRIITITGAGGVGKTAIALRLAYLFLSDPYNPFDAIIWFSAKTSRLTEEGIVPLTPGIKSHEQLITDLLALVDLGSLESFKRAGVPFSSLEQHLYNILSSQKCMVIIDNLETILKDDALTTFIKDIPRPSQVLITSRKGLGEIERRYPLTDMLERDAIQLFRIIAKERKRSDLLRLSEASIASLVKRVRCYPLLIKWSIGQVYLGKDIEAAFSEIFAGESEIAKFSFNDVFNLLSDASKLILYSMVAYGEKPCSRFILMHLSNLSEYEFEDAIKELILTSFVFPETREIDGKIITDFSMLNLTRGFIEDRFDEDKKTKEMLLTRYYHLSEQIEELEKVKTSYSQSLFSFGIKTIEQQVAFTYVKTAKILYRQGYIDEAEKNYEAAMNTAPEFSYVLMEYSKFEFERGLISKALGLAEKAVQLNPDSYHSWFHLGIFMRKINRLPDAIYNLEKARELNPTHLPIYNELGRTYTFIGEYEKANEKFNEALREEKYPNYRHKLMTLQFLADNYKRWAEAFGLRHDLSGQLKMLEKAHETILKALDINPKDKKLWKLCWDILKNYAIVTWRAKGIKEGKPLLEKCLKKANHKDESFSPDDEMIAEASFYLAALSMKEKETNKKEINGYIDQGLARCSAGSKWFLKFQEIKAQIDGEGTSERKRNVGKIKFFNVKKRYGVIESGERTYLFLEDGIRRDPPLDEVASLAGKTVSFILIENPGHKHRLIAWDVLVEK